ncbi:hypothetical protein FB470_005251 [Amycolatopsis thermophila]|uniref:Uncharacterized protein n=1 Tax=Amycolatopsis thermophila TaxID=206084 RepID=A0ABU0F110_9PSEU|nr:hypothetical protein [Amycolatopsis thermophila]
MITGFPEETGAEAVTASFARHAGPGGPAGRLLAATGRHPNRGRHDGVRGRHARPGGAGTTEGRNPSTTDERRTRIGV